ncbi:MAG: phenylalanine--tRNA ligase subunit beta [Candidatus Zixiibacteriota bacterium]
MQISYQWLKELTGLSWPVDDVAEKLTLCGIAAEEVIPTAKHLKNVVVGEVLALAEVPGASKIRKATVNIGSSTFDLICGAPNVAVGQKVPIALIGAVMANGMEIKKVTIRGVESSGMICSESELGISNDHAGIMVLDPSAPVGKPLAEFLDYDDYIIGFEVTPNRGDALSAIGIARDMAALGGVHVTRPSFTLKESKEKASDVVSVRIEDPIGCPRYAARVINNVKIGPSPWWVKKRLITSGIRPISNVVDITNLIMLECGHPLHAFDLKKFGSNEVVVRRARAGEKFVTLDEVERKLTDNVLMITNGREGVAVAGVMGGLLSGINDQTSTILLEAAYFHPIVVRKGRKEIGLVTESSYRFERSTDPNNVPYAIDRAAFLFQELCGGEVLSGIVDCYPTKIEPKTATLRPSRCRSIIGVDLPVAQMTQTLASLEFKVAGTDPLTVTIPTFRSDVETETDLIEEIARIHGWGNIPDAIENKGPLFTPANRFNSYEWDIRRVLTAVGFDEIMGHGLSDSRLSETLNPGMPQVKLTNPISDELDMMRNSLAPTALQVVSHNHSFRYMNLRLFEIGNVYCPPGDGQDWREPGKLSLVVTGQTESNWRDKPRAMDFYDLRSAIDSLAAHFHWPEVQYVPVEKPYLDSSISFRLESGGKQLGVAGKFDSTLARRFDIKPDLYFAELDQEAMMSISKDLAQFVPLPMYPAAPRDLAIIVSESVRAAELLARVKQLAGGLAEAVSIFDVYAGKQIGEGKRSIGISITYRAADRSLSSDEIDSTQKGIIAALKNEYQADIRE